MVYSVSEVQQLFNVCRNTVSNWVNTGLRPSDELSPQLFRGAELQRFQASRRNRRRIELRFGEFKCLSCGHAVFPGIKSVSMKNQINKGTLASAECSDCGANMMKLISASERDRIRHCIDINSRLAFIDEEGGDTLTGIGKKRGFQAEGWFSTNDRIVHDWQFLARSNSKNTISAHLVSIRDFERFLDGMPFKKVTPKTIAKYRDHLLRLLSVPKDQGGLSNSTVRHRVSHLRLFFVWLRGQDGYRRLSSNIPDYFALPRSVSAKPLSDDPKDYPTIDDAWLMVEKMPTTSITQRRDQAEVAFAFTSGFRAATLTALRFKHVDFERRQVFQNATEVPAKNGRSYCAAWFPKTEKFQTVFLAWAKELQELGFGDNDALFPAIKYLVKKEVGASDIQPLKTSKPLRAAFASASQQIGRFFTPHSARHCLKALGVKICRTHEQRKAWSMNLGHPDEQITERYYGKMPPSRSRELIAELNSEKGFTDEENEIIIDYHEGRFARGTDEYRMARQLAEEREAARGDWKDGDLRTS